jgi:hypothetical protein
VYGGAKSRGACTHAHALSLSLAHTRTHTHSLSISISISRYISCSLFLALSCTRALSLSLNQVHAGSISDSDGRILVLGDGQRVEHWLLPMVSGVRSPAGFTHRSCATARQRPVRCACSTKMHTPGCIGSHACSLEARACMWTIAFLSGGPLFLPARTVNCMQTQKGTTVSLLV